MGPSIKIRKIGFLHSGIVESYMEDIVETPINPALALRKRYILALSIIAILIISSQIGIQITIARNDDDSRVVNVAGRQRMLSQKISKSALAILDATSSDARGVWAKELGDAALLWRRQHDGLLQGSEELGLHGRNSKAILAMFSGIEPRYELMLDAAAALHAATIDASTPPSVLRTLAEPILTNEAAFLQGMNAITNQYDSETRSRMDFIRALEYALLAVIILILALEAMFIFRPAERQIGRYFREMKRAMEILRERATFDDLTGLFNKNTGLVILGREMEKARRVGSPLSLCFIDLDGLKSVNDSWGHEEGDFLISCFATIIRDAVRAEDAAFRFGGDEFILVLCCSEERAMTVVARVRKGVEELNATNRKPWRFAFSQGIAVYDPASGLTAAELISRADERMYCEKKFHHAAARHRA
jgi:diguanylate cyclase (GGDEF)-like protein